MDDLFIILMGLVGLLSALCLGALIAEWIERKLP